jgi:NodT family efflux transporter outer membrane factor (OMF) lipoprotein
MVNANAVRLGPIRRFAVLVSLAMLLSSCAPALPLRSIGDLPLADHYMGARPPPAIDDGAGEAQRFSRDSTGVEDWWRCFGSPSLDRLIDDALRSSPSIASARQRLAEAAKYFRAEQGDDRLPRIDLDVSAKRQQVNTAAIGVPMMPNPPPFTAYDAGLTMGYDLDLFGALRHRVAAKGYETLAKAYELRAAQLALASNIAAAAIEEARLREAIGIDERQLENRQALSRTLRARYGNGSAHYGEVLAVEAQVAHLGSELPPLRQSLAQVRTQLAVYAGASDTDALPQFHLSDLQLPSELPLVVPSSLVRRRPDIRAAEAALQVAREMAGIAEANRFPQIELRANIGTMPLSLGHLFAGETAVWNLGAQLSAPLFHGGALRARRDAAYAAYNAVFEDYRQVVLKALQNVADAMTAIDHGASASKALHVEMQSNAARYDMIRARMANGSADIVDVLDAEQTLDRVRFEVARARASRLANTASFFAATGGSVETHP